MDEEELQLPLNSQNTQSVLLGDIKIVLRDSNGCSLKCKQICIEQLKCNRFVFQICVLVIVVTVVIVLSEFCRLFFELRIQCNEL